MFDGFWFGIFGALTSVKKFEHPTPLVYFIAFLGGATVAEAALFSPWDRPSVSVRLSL